MLIRESEVSKTEASSNETGRFQYGFLIEHILRRDLWFLDPI